MTEDEMRYITTVGRMGSMSKAAEEMYITRSALSRCIKKVEEELDTPLFKRVPSGIVPTQAGEIYIRYAEKFLTEIRKMKSEIYEISKEYSGTVYVGATYSIVASVLSRALSWLQETYPNIHCVIYDYNVRILEEHLQCGKIDFLLCHYPEQQSVGLRYLPLANETLYLVMARSCYDRISEERPDVFNQIPWDELQSLPFYLTQSYYRDRQLIDLALKDMNLEPVHVQELCSYYSIFGLVENDLGVTIAPSVNCQPFLQNEKLVFIKIPWNNQAVDALYAVVQEGLPLSPSAQIVLDACTREFLSMNHE